MPAKKVNTAVLADGTGALELISNILESSTEYSVIGKSLDGTILLWNEGARRMYGYDADDVVGKANSEMLYTPEDVALGKSKTRTRASTMSAKHRGAKPALAPMRTGSPKRSTSARRRSPPCNPYRGEGSTHVAPSP